MMIHLKKNDKIIILIAVVVIVIAGIGIALYESPKEDENGTDGQQSDKYLFYIDWESRMGAVTPISEFAGKSAPYEGMISFNKGNLKTVMFNLSWVDDKATFLGRFGLDTLTLQITTPDGTIYEESARSASKTRDGNIMISVPVSMSVPSNEPIEAEDYDEALQMLNEEPYYNDKWVNEEFTITVSVHVGEVRILKKMMEKGNGFDLDITYEYYQGTLMEDQTVETGGGDGGEETPYEPPYLSMLMNTGSARYI